MRPPLLSLIVVSFSLANLSFSSTSCSAFISSAKLSPTFVCSDFLFDNTLRTALLLTLVLSLTSGVF